MIPRGLLRNLNVNTGRHLVPIRTFLSTSACLRAENPKPKASTPLRKSAAASIPLREKPSASQGQIQSIFTLTTAERYNLQKLRKSLPEGAQLFQDAFWVPRWISKESEGEVFVFYSNGSIVCWGLSEEDALQFSQTHLTIPKVEIGPLEEPETEDLDFIKDPSEPTRLQGDLIVLGYMAALDTSTPVPQVSKSAFLSSETFHARYAFSQALARSTSLSALESALDNYLSSVSKLPDTLSSTGKPGLSRIELIKKLGELLKFRQGLNLNRENFEDIPDFYWAEASLEKYFKSLSEALEIKARTASFNQKITYAAEVQSVLRQLLTEASSHRMELIIIALIAVEVVIAIIRDGPELWEMIAGKHQDETKPKKAVPLP